MNDRDERIRRRAHQMWMDEGCPEGRADVHWDKASELVAIEDNQMLATQPIPPRNEDNVISPDADAEPIGQMANLGEFPTLTDQGEEQTFPDPMGRRAAG